ncbi:hypothetical protein N431DRAFT_449711 [Stipitochalara longipes BDJ]|nr:hypothetical protein N431DRAFT_449711 [Stipitochalara longipes BDJ]
MADQSPSPAGTSQAKRDILTTVPHEILIKIIAQLPSKYYLDLVHTSKALRNFIKINASRICNEAIRSRFALEAAILKSELKSGCYRDVYHHRKTNLRSLHKMDYSLLGPLQPATVAIKLSSPGPQYLHFLEQGILLIGIGLFEQRQNRAFRIAGENHRVNIGGQTYFFNIMRDSLYLYPGEPNFEAFSFS